MYSQGDVLLCTVNLPFLGAKSNYSFRRVPTADMTPFGTCHVMGTVLSVAHLLSVCNVLQVQEVGWRSG